MQIFELFESLKKACDNKEMLNKLLLSLKPDFFYIKENRSNVPQMTLDFTLLKIIKKIASKGIELKTLFDKWDADGSGERKYSK